MSRVSLYFKLTDRRANRHDDSNSLFRQFFANVPTTLTDDFGHCPSSLLTLYCKIRISHTFPPESRTDPVFESLLSCEINNDVGQRLTYHSLYQPTNTFNKIRENAKHEIQFMTSSKLLHVSAPKCHPQGIYHNGGTQVQHANLGIDIPNCCH